MEQLLGLDVGEKRVGLALGTTNPAFAAPLITLERSGGHAEAEILKIVREKAIKIVVVGLPVNEQGGRTSQCAKIEKFCERLRKRADIEIRFVDEYLSSLEAIEIMGVSAKKSRGVNKESIDSIAAALILRRYLEEQVA